MRNLTAAACLLAGLCLPLTAHADDPRVDNDGRDMGNYPPARHFDHLHMLLEVDIPDMG